MVLVWFWYFVFWGSFIYLRLVSKSLPKQGWFWTSDLPVSVSPVPRLPEYVSELVCAVLGSNPGLHAWDIQSNFLKVGEDFMKLSNSKSENKESNGNTKKLVTGSTTNSANHIVSKVLSIPASLLSSFSFIPFFKETKTKFSKVLKVRVCIEPSESFDIWY